MKTYSTKGVCAKEINFKIEDNRLIDIHFVNGCPGNLIGLTALVKGLHIDDVITKLKGIECGDKSTSCPDQLAIALEQYKAL